jgi:hypothetical protein
LSGNNYFIEERGYIHHNNQYEGYWDMFMFSSYDIGNILTWDRGSDLWMYILMIADAQEYL